MTKICRTNCSYDLAKTTRLATPLSTKSCLVKYEPFVERSPILKTACIVHFAKYICYGTYNLISTVLYRERRDIIFDYP